MNVFRRAAFLSVLAAFISPVLAKPRSGIPSDSYDGKPVGARYVGAGELGASVSAGPQSPAWNPAGLSDLADPVFAFDLDAARRTDLDESIVLNASSLRGRRLTYLGVASAQGALFYRPLAGYETLDVLDPADPAQNFRRDELSVSQFGVGWTSPLGDKPGAHQGFALSYINAHRGLARAAAGQPPEVELADGHGVSLDIGLLWRGEHASMGLAARNLPGYIFWDEYKAERIPTIARAGASFHPVPAFSFHTEYEKRFYARPLPKSDIWHMGVESSVQPWLQLRAGLFGEDLNDSDKTTYTMGFSVSSPRRHRLDVAVRRFRLAGERVDNLLVSLSFPLTETKPR